MFYPSAVLAQRTLAGLPVDVMTYTDGSKLFMPLVTAWENHARRLEREQELQDRHEVGSA